MKPTATKSMFLGIYDIDRNHTTNIITDPFNARFEKKGKKGRFTLFHKRLEKDGEDLAETGKKYNIVVMGTNDPTPKTGMDVVSLGYYRFLLVFNDCKCVRKTVPTFEGHFKSFRDDMLLPLREVV